MRVRCEFVLPGVHTQRPWWLWLRRKRGVVRVHRN